MTPHTEYLKYDFTEQEKSQFGADLARASQSRDALEMKKKSVDAQLKSEIAAESETIAILSKHIVVGHEYREIECLCTMNQPEPGKKEVYRQDTGEYVKVLPMTDQDRQMVLDLKEK